MGMGLNLEEVSDWPPATKVPSLVPGQERGRESTVNNFG